MNELNPDEKYALRFGEVAIDLGFIDGEQLQEALLEQFSLNDSARFRHRKLIGELLVEKGWLTLHQVDLVLKYLYSLNSINTRYTEQQ
jgi:hypothetical protein